MNRLPRFAAFILLALSVVFGIIISSATGEPAAKTDPLDSIPRIPHKEPPEALQTFKTLHGFRMQLVASEPLVADPVDMAFDENGRAYVVEMRGYPFPEEKNAPPNEFIGRVRLLEDRNADGKYDASYVFAADLAWPTSVVCWKGGVFVAAAPDIWYFKDTTGDGVADVRRKVFTGFSRYNVQAIMNGLRFGLDHKIYGAASGNGGSVTTLANGPKKPIAVRRRDFRFDPTDDSFEAISGGQRFGNTFDDWGNRFLCNIRNPVQHVVLPSRYLARNPALAVSQTVHDAALSGDQIRVYRISPPEIWRQVRAHRWSADRVNYPRSELTGAGFWTSSSGVTIYRGSAYPKNFLGNVFIGEVAGNLVQRQTLKPNGVTFTSERADQNAEFISSTDNWFRPVNFANAPDGTLYLLDMYRETIEHPWSIPDDIRARLDLSSGNQRGRIYRIAPPGFKFQPPPRLGDAATEQLVGYLEHPNAWHRETAHRLIHERQDSAAAPLLRKLLHNSKLPQGRLHALWSLRGLGALAGDDLLAALQDSSPRVREHAVRLAESQLESAPLLLEKVLRLAGDEDARVRFQTAFSLGELSGGDLSENKDQQAVIAALSRIAVQDAGDRWARIAVLSSSGQIADRLLVRLLGAKDYSDRRGAAEMIKQLAVMVGAGPKGAPMNRVLAALAAAPDNANGLDLQYALTAGLGEGLTRRKISLADFINNQKGPAAARLKSLMQRAQYVAANEKAPVEQRLQAVELLRRHSSAIALETLPALLDPQQPQNLQLASIRALGSFRDAAVASAILNRWRRLSPPVRSEAIQTLVSRNEWIAPFLVAIEEGKITASQVPIPLRSRLLRNPNADLAKRAIDIFGPQAVSPRKEAIAKFRPALALSGDRQRGAKVFQRECMACHRLGQQGHDIGPNLATVRHRSAEELLIHILDPNREVSPSFIDFSIVLEDGRISNGVIVSETDTSITLRRAENVQETILRKDIEEIVSSGKSIMPEGFEQKISQRDLADIISLLLTFE